MSRERSSTKPRSLASISALISLIIALAIAWQPHAVAEQTAFRGYSKADGLTNAWASCLVQDASGFILVCTEHGLFSYNGRRFSNLGPRQGLPDGGFVHALTRDSRNRIVLRFPHSIFVSDQPINGHDPPGSLMFHAAQSASPIEDDERGDIVPWRDGAVFAADGRLYVVRYDDHAAKPVVALAGGALARQSFTLQDATPLASQGATLWAARTDGAICGLSDAKTSCFGTLEGLPNDNWAALLVTRNGHVLARSPSHLADINPASGTIEVSNLPTQGGRYANYPHRLVLVEDPAGQILTQSSDGLIIGRAAHWQALSQRDGLPTAPVLSVLFDRDKGLWLGVLGKGVLRDLGYGLWENLDHRDGLSNDVLWQMSREPNGPLWIANDNGVDAIGPLKPPSVHRHFDRPAFAVTTDDFGHLWRSEGSSGIACIALGTGHVDHFTLPAVNKILHGAKSSLWFLTERGLYLVPDSARPSAPKLFSAAIDPVSAAAADADGSLWMIRKNLLVHMDLDGAEKIIRTTWPQSDFQPLTLAISKAGVLWIGGAGGGLYRLTLVDGRVTAMAQFGSPDIVSNTIVSLLVDSRQWVWVGTDNGVSVFDGKRWVSANTDSGLIWDDLDQGSLYEDADGSMWLGTSQGLSHLLNPARLFQQSSLRPVITAVHLGQDDVQERTVPYTREPLEIQFGTLNFQADGVIRFRYRLDGVDKGWAETASGLARYPSLPAGRHLFSVVAYNPLTHEISPPVTLLLRMRKPWWFSWPLVALYGFAATGAAYGLLRLRIRLLLRQKSLLQREVDLQTQEIRRAQEALQVLATQDSLTKLLTRGEIQSRLDRVLAQNNRSQTFTIGLLDIDHFKRINDRFGHLIGDEILREIGCRLRQAMGPDDYAGRYGGEEILIVVPGDGKLGVEQIYSLNDAVCSRLFPVEEQFISVTCSIGVTHALPHDDWKTVIDRADQALYKAKAQGRDRIVVSAAMVPVEGGRASSSTERRPEQPSATPWNRATSHRS